MAIEIECDSCHASYRVADTMAGKRVRCKQCGKAILVPAFASPLGAGGGVDTDDDPLKAISSLAEPSSSSSSSSPPSDADVLGGTPVESEWTSEVNAWDISASMAEIRGRLSARPTRAFAYPLSDLVDAFLPWVLIAGFLGPALVAAVRGILASGDEQMTGWVQLALAAILFAALIIPLTVRALRSAGRSFKFRVPDQAYFRIFAAFSVAVGMGSFFYTQLGWQGFYFGFGLGAFVGALLLGVLFHLLPVEIFFTALFTLGFFLVTSVVSFYAVTGSRSFVNLLAASASGGKKNVAKAPAKPASQAATKPAAGIALVPTEAPKPVEPTPITSAPVELPKPKEPEIPVLAFRSDSPAVQESVVLDRPRDFDSVLYPLTAGSAVTHMAAIHRTVSGDDTVEIWTLDPGPASPVVLPLKRQANASDRYAVNSSGDTFARLISWPKLAAQLISVESQKTRSVELDPTYGQPEILGFTTPETLAVHFSRNGMCGVELWDLKNNKIGRLVGLPADVPHALAFSPDGKLAAAAVPPGEARESRSSMATVQIVDLSTGHVVRKLNVAGLDPKLPLAVAGIAFSPDSSKVALLCENNDNLLIENWDLKAGSIKPVNEHVFAAGQLPLANLSQFPGRCFDWLPDGHAWLLYGNVVVDVPTGAPLATFNFSDVRSQQIISPNTLQLEFQHPTEPRALGRVTLNPQALEDARKK